MSNLRKKLIRLAYQKPELRSEILPLLKTAGSHKIPSKTAAKSLEDFRKAVIRKFPDASFNKKQQMWDLGDGRMVMFVRHGDKTTIDVWTSDSRPEKIKMDIPVKSESDAVSAIKKTKTAAKSSGDPNVDQAAKDIVTAIKKKGWPEPSWLYDPNAILLEWGSDQGNASVRVGLQSYRGKPTAIFTTPRSRPMRSVAKAIGQLIEDSEKGVQKTAYGMKSVAKFYTLAEAVAFVESYKHDNVRIEKELDGRFHVYDMR